MVFSRVGIIGDVHTEVERLETALCFFQEAHVERILCVGDIVDGRGNANACCELLSQEGVAVVRGNHDRWLLNGVMRNLPEATPIEELNAHSKLFLEALPPTLSFETVAGPMLLCHGLGDNDMQRLTPDDYGYALEVNEPLQQLIRQKENRFVVGGHTHHRMVRHFGYLTVINVGTLYDAHEPCIALADFAAQKIQFHNFVGHCIKGTDDISLSSP